MILDDTSIAYGDSCVDICNWLFSNQFNCRHRSRLEVKLNSHQVDILASLRLLLRILDDRRLRFVVFERMPMAWFYSGLVLTEVRAVSLRLLVQVQELSPSLQERVM